MNRFIGTITYLCPACGEELHREQRCPHCNILSKPFDLYAEAIEQERQFDEWQLASEGWNRRYDN
jgi:hypothetical protein